MAAVEVWGARGKLDSFTLTNPIYTIGSDAESTEAKLHATNILSSYEDFEGSAFIGWIAGLRLKSPVALRRLAFESMARHMPKGADLTGKTFVVTGKLENYKRKEIEDQNA